MKLITAILLSSNAKAVFAALRNAGPEREQPDPFERNNGNANAFMPDFLSDSELPSGLADNPSHVVGVDFKPGKVPRAQVSPNLRAKKKVIIRGLDNKPIKLDIDSAERINVFHPDKYTLSADGTCVTENETGEVFKLDSFYSSDHKNQFDVVYSIDDDGYLANVRVAPKFSEDESTRGLRKDDVTKVQNFQRLDNTDILVGYMDDEMDLSNVGVSGDMSWYEPGDDPAVEQNGDDGDKSTRRRRAQATYSKTLWGKTCDAWDYLDVRIVTDKAFRDFAGRSGKSDGGKAREVFEGAAEIYWKESCVQLYMWGYQSTVGNALWVNDNEFLDDWIAFAAKHRIFWSGCDIFKPGLLQILQATVLVKQHSAYRDAWHMFTGANFDGSTIGCAYIDACKSGWRGYGVNQISFSTNPRLQAVLFAHELGHTLGLHHLDTNNGWWVMEPNINTAPLDLYQNHAYDVRREVVFGSCGWYD